ncbi:MarR family transcriptional regulator [uncultured Paracoccus sp.]|uniref:MarR family winged helix-turn-helix transcriptional regulator n=1 Tax=uncultured Paracoccus sp. TaxID=189685 RepID=UPI002624806B|nr:MarR family transcriptional regulator [uncultured Paracoccus sp.]
MSEPDRAARAVAQWRREMPQMDVSAMEVIGRLNDLSTVIGRDHLEPLFAGFGLQRGEFDVLATLRRAGAPFTLTPTDLYEATMMTSGGMTARLDRLEKRGLIARRPNPEDRRGTLVSLTEEGRVLVEAAVVPHAANEARLLSVLSEEEREQLNALLRRLRAALPVPA